MQLLNKNEIINRLTGNCIYYYYGSSAFLKYKNKQIKVFKILINKNITYLTKIIPNLSFDNRYKSNGIYFTEDNYLFLFLCEEIEENEHIKYLKHIKNKYNLPLYHYFYSPNNDRFYILGELLNLNNYSLYLNNNNIELEDILDMCLFFTNFEQQIEINNFDLIFNYYFQKYELYKCFEFILNTILTSYNPYNALIFLDNINLITKIFPFLNNLKGIKQDRIFHPEGDVYQHTLNCIQYIKNPSLRLIFGIFLHDYGKIYTKKNNKFDGHSDYGANKVEKILSPFGFDKNFINDVIFLVKYHMVNSYFYRITEDIKKDIFDSELGVDLMKLYKADTLGSIGKLDEYVDIYSNLKKDKNIKNFR